jgi:hypothetical protein
MSSLRGDLRLAGMPIVSLEALTCTEFPGSALPPIC